MDPQAPARIRRARDEIDRRGFLATVVEEMAGFAATLCRRSREPVPIISSPAR